METTNFFHFEQDPNPTGCYCHDPECLVCRQEMSEGQDCMLMRTGQYPEYFIPSRYFVQNLAVGDLAPSPSGRGARVTCIHGSGLDWQGRAYVCYYTELGPTSRISNSLKEGELLRTTRITARRTSAELDRIEWEMGGKR